MRPAMRRSSGPTPAIGLMAPPSTWYLPRNSRVRSIATTSLGSSTTQMVASERRGSRHTRHSSSCATLPQRSQKRTLFLTSVRASTSRLTSSGSAARRWKAMRWALLGPTPGSRPSSSIRSWTAPSYTRPAYGVAGTTARTARPGGAAQPSSTCSAITVPPSISATSGTPTRPVSSSTGSEWSISSIAWAYSASSTSSGLAPTCDASAPDEAPPTSHGGGAVLDGGADPAGDGALGAVPPGGEAALASDPLTVGMGRALGAGPGAGGAPGAGAAAGGAALGASAPAGGPPTRTPTPCVSRRARRGPRRGRGGARERPLDGREGTRARGGLGCGGCPGCGGCRGRCRPRRIGSREGPLDAHVDAERLDERALDDVGVRAVAERGREARRGEHEAQGGSRELAHLGVLAHEGPRRAAHPGHGLEDLGPAPAQQLGLDLGRATRRRRVGTGGRRGAHRRCGGRRRRRSH